MVRVKPQLCCSFRGLKADSSRCFVFDQRIVFELHLCILFVFSPPVTAFTGHASPKTTQVKYIEETDEPYFGASGVGVVAHAMVDEPMRLGHVQGERYRHDFCFLPVSSLLN